MPLPHPIRAQVVDYVLRDLAPPSRHQLTPLEWFVSCFAFILDSDLKNRLGEAFYQARLMEKLRGALYLKGDFNNSFVQFQIVLYASIYEAVIDYKLSQLSHLETIRNLTKEKSLTAVREALGTKTRIFFTDGSDVEHKLILCREGTRTQKLKEIQFSKRLKTAVEIGLVPKDLEVFIDQLYTNRNCLHLLNASDKDYAPIPDVSEAAFRNMKQFLAHVKSWAPKSPAN